MGTKSRLEYEVRHMKLDGNGWNDDCPTLVCAISEMAAEGWILVSLAIPNNNNAMLAFSRPRAAPAPSGGDA